MVSRSALVLTGGLLFLGTACTASDQAADPAGRTDDAVGSGPVATVATSGPHPGTEPFGADHPEEPIAENDMFPDVVGATSALDGDVWTLSVTLSSPYDTPERYADAWRVKGPNGEVYAERVLTHDHASEQPFTRSQSGIVIPDDVDVVVIEGRDLEFGYGGDTFELALTP